MAQPNCITLLKKSPDLRVGGGGGHLIPGAGPSVFNTAGMCERCSEEGGKLLIHVGEKKNLKKSVHEGNECPIK